MLASHRNEGSDGEGLRYHKADMEADLQAHKEAHAGGSKELMATMKYISSLHYECDWLLQYFDVRKEARAGEVESLNKAKAVLSGADLQYGARRAQAIVRVLARRCGVAGRCHM